VVYSVALVVYVVSVWTKAVRTPFGIFCCFPFTTSGVSISSRFVFMVGCGHWSIWLIVSSVKAHPGYWLVPEMWCLIWPIWSHLCIILHVCIRLVLGRLRWTELIDAQLIVLIVSFDHEYLFFMYVVSARVQCASYIDFL
jgi:hypothetical protein